MRKIIGLKALIGCGVAVVIQLTIVVILHDSLREQIEADRWENHAYEVAGRLQALLLHLTEAETSRRGYILAGDAQHLAPFSPAVESIAHDLARLREMTADDPAQQKLLRAVEPAIGQKLDLLKESIALQQAGRSDATTQAALTDRGKAVMDQIRQAIATMTGKAERTLARRVRSKEEGESRTFILILCGLASSVVLFSIAFFFLWHENTVRARAQDGLTRANLKLGGKLMELERLHWLISKVEDVLPICMGCGKVKTSATSWKDIAQYLKDNKLLLSHGYCPECLPKVKAQFELETGEPPAPGAK
ncbi:MAG: CHASE3 domain-containing protein [Verrucomicrobia bacterium]|nr:CHASE3 domain-containing protein [Verrucomicrobiota bacterium]